MPEEEIKKSEEVWEEIQELVKKTVGKINSFDSNRERATTTDNVLNSVIAGAELSRLEKIGILTTLTQKRIKG